LPSLIHVDEVDNIAKVNNLVDKVDDVHKINLAEVKKSSTGSALTKVCEYGDMELLDLLLTHPKIDVNQILFKGSTVLHHVCRENQLAQLKRLLQHTALKLNHQTDVGLTPLLVACQCGNSQIVSELMKYKKVNPNICDSQKRTALWLAAKKGFPSIFLSILCTPHWVIDTATKPEDEQYPQQFAEYLGEYLSDSDKFQEKYRGTRSYEHPNPGKLSSFALIFSTSLSLTLLQNMILFALLLLFFSF